MSLTENETEALHDQLVDLQSMYGTENVVLMLSSICWAIADLSPIVHRRQRFLKMSHDLAGAAKNWNEAMKQEQ